MKFLLIDDDPEYRQLLRHHLTARWPQAACVEHDPRVDEPLGNGFDGKGFDAVLLDYQLGPTSGLDLLAEFQKHDGFPPVIMITGAGNERLAVEAIRAGAADYIPKSGLKHELLVAAVSQATGLDPHARADPKPSPRPKARVSPGLKSIGGFQLLKQIGVGAGGYVYQGRDADQRLAAVKLIPLSGRSERIQGLLRQAVTEITAVTRRPSPYLPKLMGHGRTEEFAYLCLEWLSGGSLKSRMQSDRAPTVRQALMLVREIASALDTLHGAGLVHRDLKPDNIMYRDDNTLVLIDFGASGALHQPTELVAGTPYYMSPEQIRGEGLDGRSDLYALGVLLHELLTGAPPYRARSVAGIGYKHLHAPMPELPRGYQSLQGLLNRLMAKSPAQRFRDAATAAQAIDLLIDSLPN